jgi:hypothetical protein
MLLFREFRNSILKNLKRIMVDSIEGIKTMTILSFTGLAIIFRKK